MLASKDKEVVEWGAFFIAAQGDPAQAASVLAASQRALDVWEEPRTRRLGEHVNLLDPPQPLRGLLAAIDALRDRGWRTDGMGGAAVIIAHFRQLADPKMPRPTDDRWKQSVHAFLTQNPATMRQNALLAIPQPMTDEWEKDILTALEDQDWGVLRTACEVAGKSGRKRFIRPLAEILETVHERFVQNAADNALAQLGARMERWTAWSEVIPDEPVMVEALTQLILGTLALPKSHASVGNSNFTRTERFAIRDAWRAFLKKNHDRLEAGARIAPSDPSVTPLLTGAKFHPDQPAVVIEFGDGTSWPPVKRPSR